MCGPAHRFAGKADLTITVQLFVIGVINHNGHYIGKRQGGLGNITGGFRTLVEQRQRALAGQTFRNFLALQHQLVTDRLGGNGGNDQRRGTGQKEDADREGQYQLLTEGIAVQEV